MSRDSELMPDMLRAAADFLDANDDLIREVMPYAIAHYRAEGHERSLASAEALLARWNDYTPNEHGDTIDGMQRALRDMADYIAETEGLTALSETWSMKHPEHVRAFRKLGAA